MSPRTRSTSSEGLRRLSLRTYRATTVRILAQLRADRRTVGLILAVPTVLLVLLYFIYRDTPMGPVLFDRIAVDMIGILPMAVMFLVTSVAMLRERATGTLERLWTTPAHRADVLFGYATAFAVTAVGQALVLCAVTYWALGVTTQGSPAWIVLIAALDAVVGVSLGLLASTFARTEFQAVQFMPIMVGPQIFLCGLLVERDELPTALRWLSNVLPMSWAVDAVGQVRSSAEVSGALVRDLVILVAIALGCLALGPVTMPRRSR